MSDRSVVTEPDPPFFRGEVGHWLSSHCDYLAPGEDDACDGWTAYEVQWVPVPALDLDSLPTSGVCEKHAVHVDRSLVRTIRTHPLAQSHGGPGAIAMPDCTARRWAR